MAERNRQDLVVLLSFSLIQIAYFGWMSWGKQDWMNTDAVSYIRIAQYYASGQIDLMISGYWGPLLSWIIVPLLLFVDEPLSAAYMAMGVSSLVLLLGGWAVFRSMRLGFPAMVVALGIVMFFSVSWSVRFITPDVLVSGMLCLAISRIMVPEWCDKVSVQLSAGLLFGGAYLAKAVAFPLSFMLITAAAIIWILCQQISLGRALRSVAMTFIGMSLIAGPWILLLSLKYERPVFSTSAEINHTIIGPSSVSQGHPTFHEFHVPEQGRVTSWEDPNPAAYARWSPLESSKHMNHQLDVIKKNAQSSLNLLKSSDWLGVGLIAVIFGFLFHVPWNENMRLQRWRWSAVFIGCLVGIYLPVVGRDMRYYLATYPFLVGGSLGFVGSLVRGSFTQAKLLYSIALALIAVSFLLPLASVPPRGPNPDYQAAKILKEQLQALNIIGPIASTSESEDIAYYTAFLLEVPYHGKSPQAQTVEEVRSSAAKIIIVDQGASIDSQLKKTNTFISLDETLFDSLKEKLESDVKVYINTKM